MLLYLLVNYYLLVNCGTLQAAIVHMNKAPLPGTEHVLKADKHFFLKTE